MENIVIVDNHPKYILSDVVSKYSEFVSIKYIKNTINSLFTGDQSTKITLARLCYLDDDVILYDELL